MSSLKESHIIINCDRPTEYYIDRIIEETVIELEEVVGRGVINRTGSKSLLASLKEEA